MCGAAPDRMRVGQSSLARDSQVDVRESQKTSGKQVAVAKPAVTKPVAAKPAAATDAEHIISLRASGPTKETHPIIKICARTQLKVRLLITTVLVEKYPRPIELLAEMSRLVQTGTATKADLLALRPKFAPQ